MYLVSKKTLLAHLSATLSDPVAIGAALDAAPVPLHLPDDLERWLGRLKLLYGVPYNYLVPDERMLPPESLRFFYVDLNWVDTLLDGAFSIGRNLSTGANDASSSGQHLDAAVQPKIQGQINAQAGSIRATALGTAPVAVDSSPVVTGFLLRSSVVQQYPGLGVNAFLHGQTPDDTPDPTLVPILRFERLGPSSDILLCLLLGDVWEVDIHEAPEQLHYGIDDYVANPTTKAVTKAIKTVRLFTKTGDQVDFPLGKDKNPVTADADITTCFREQSPRTLKTMDLVNVLQTKLKLTTFDSAEFGFEMTEGVGNVRFTRPAPTKQ